MSRTCMCSYRVEGEMNADPETVFRFIDPTPESPRSGWDRAIKELQIVDSITEVGHFCTFCAKLCLIRFTVVIKSMPMLMLTSKQESRTAKRSWPARLLRLWWLQHDNCALILYRRRPFINHLLTYLLT